MRALPQETILTCRVWRVLTITSALAFFTLAASVQGLGQHGGGHPGGGGPGRPMPAPAPRSLAPTGRSEYVDRYSHGSVRHSDTHVVPRYDTGAQFQGHVGEVPHQNVVVSHDFDARFPGHHHYDDFAFHRFVPALPLGFITLQVGGVPYYYSDGIYYQPMTGGYQEVYPPVGAMVAQPPDGSIPVAAGGQTYYYAGGAFYLQQADGTYQLAPPPIGAVVPELPPGAVQVSLSDGSVAYQFNGVYYRPVFVNGVTQYETVTG